MKIMFVCAGNICRSPLAHAEFDRQARADGQTHLAESAGTGAWHVGDLPDARMRRTARAHGLELDHRARQFLAADLDEYDLVLAMDRDNLRQIRGLAATEDQRRKARLFRDFDPEGRPGAEVPDPYNGDAQGFEEVYRIVERSCRRLLAVLKEAGR
jgi:protein-tyrosine phosphatase